MPRQVDHDERKRDIARAALRLLAHRGPSGLTFRSLAQEMGGSLTLITHYYATRDELLLDIPAQLAIDWERDLAELDADPDPRERLRGLLEWLLPLDEEGKEDEWARFALLVARQEMQSLNSLRQFDAYIREQLRQHVAPLVEEKQVDATVDLLRAITDGIVVNALSNPEAWPAERQLALVHRALDQLL